MVINPIVGVYIPIIRIPTKGGMTILNIATFDPGSYNIYYQTGRVSSITFPATFLRRMEVERLESYGLQGPRLALVI